MESVFGISITLLFIMCIILGISAYKDYKIAKKCNEEPQKETYTENDFTGITYSNRDPIIIEKPKENKEPEYKKTETDSVENDFTNIKYSNRDPIIIERQYVKPGTVAEEQQKQSEVVSEKLSYSEQYEAWINASKEPKALPYKAKKLFTPTEYKFHKYLMAVCDPCDLRLCPKVRMEDFIEVTTKKEKMKYRGYIKSRHIDYLITDKDYNIICAIELDDATHNNKEVQKTDELKNEIYKTIGIPLYRVKTSDDYKQRVIEIMTYSVNTARSRYKK